VVWCGVVWWFCICTSIWGLCLCLCWLVSGRKEKSGKRIWGFGGVAGGGGGGSGGVLVKCMCWCRYRYRLLIVNLWREGLASFFVIWLSFGVSWIGFKFCFVLFCLYAHDGDRDRDREAASVRVCLVVCLIPTTEGYDVVLSVY